jgi:hypothetical protein
MTDDRLPTELWLKAHLRRCSAEGVPAVVARRGEKTGGMVLLKLNQRERGVRLLGQTRDLEGRLAWLPALGGELVPEAEADAYIERAVRRDPDIWVVEIEHPDGWHPFEGKVL